MLNDNTPNNNLSNFNSDTSLPKELIPEVLPVSFKLSKETEIDIFLDKMQKKKVSDEIRQRKWEKKLQDNSSPEVTFQRESDSETLVTSLDSVILLNEKNG